MILSRFIRRILGESSFPLRPEQSPLVEPQVYQPLLVSKRVIVPPPAPPPP